MRSALASRKANIEDGADRRRYTEARQEAEDSKLTSLSNRLWDYPQ